MIKQSFNFNDRIRFKPTIEAMDYLLKVYEDFWYNEAENAESLHQVKLFEKLAEEYVVPKMDEEGYISFTVWDFMNKFGDIMTLGLNIPNYFLDYYLEIR